MIEFICYFNIKLGGPTARKTSADAVYEGGTFRTL